MSENTTSPLAELARLQSEADAAKAKMERTAKDVETLTKRVAKERGVYETAQKAFDAKRAEIERQLSGKK